MIFITKSTVLLRVCKRRNSGHDFSAAAHYCVYATVLSAVKDGKITSYFRQGGESNLTSQVIMSYCVRESDKELRGDNELLQDSTEDSTTVTQNFHMVVTMTPQGILTSTCKTTATVSVIKR